MFNTKIKYLREPKFNHTGFLPNDSIIRIKQGLSPQEISNNCQYLEPDSIDKDVLIRAGGVCNQKFLYPFPATPLIYDQDPRFQKYPVKEESMTFPSLNEKKEPLASVYNRSRNRSLGKSGEIPNSCSCAQWVMPI